MKMNAFKTAELGDVIVAAFDKAARYSTDPRTVSHMATQAVLRILRRSVDSKVRVSPQPPSTPAVARSGCSTRRARPRRS
jgi:hypothetical protein